MSIGGPSPTSSAGHAHSHREHIWKIKGKEKTKEKEKRNTTERLKLQIQQRISQIGSNKQQKAEYMKTSSLGVPTNCKPKPQRSPTKPINRKNDVKGNKRGNKVKEKSRWFLNERMTLFFVVIFVLFSALFSGRLASPLWVCSWKRWRRQSLRICWPLMSRW